MKVCYPLGHELQQPWSMVQKDPELRARHTRPKGRAKAAKETVSQCLKTWLSLASNNLRPVIAKYSCLRSRCPRP